MRLEDKHKGVIFSSCNLLRDMSKFSLFLFLLDKRIRIACLLDGMIMTEGVRIQKSGTSCTRPGYFRFSSLPFVILIICQTIIGVFDFCEFRTAK